MATNTSNETNRSEWNVATSNSSLYDYFDGYEKSDCRVSSNDPSRNDKSRIQSALPICNFTQYTCVMASTGADTRVPVQVPYEYELHYHASVAPDLDRRVLPYLEESMLQQIAQALGIAQCRQRRERLERKARQQRQRQQLQQLERPWQPLLRRSQEMGRFAGASLEPRDAWNDRCGNCLANNSYVAEGYECLPIRGEMTVLVQLTPQEQAQQLVVTEEDKETIRDVVAMYIQEIMDDDSLVVTDYIEKVVYTGDNTCGGGVLAVDAVASNGGAGNMNGTGWSKAFKLGLWAGLVLLLLLLLCCCCLCFCCGRRRRRRQAAGTAGNTGNAADSNPTSANGMNVSARGMSRSSVAGGRRSPSRSTVTPVWGTLSVEDDGTDGVERCLASRDSLALRQAQSSDAYKPSFDEESVGTTRTSVASGSVVPRDSPDSPRDMEEPGDVERDRDVEPVHEERIDEVPKEITQLVPPVDTQSHNISNIKAEDFELLDRLAAATPRPISPDGTAGGDTTASMHTHLFSAAASLSPTTTSQVTALAGNLRPTVDGDTIVADLDSAASTRAASSTMEASRGIESPSSAQSRSPALTPIVTTGLLASAVAATRSSRTTSPATPTRESSGHSSPGASPRTPTRTAGYEERVSPRTQTRTAGFEERVSPVSPRTPTRPSPELVSSPRTPTRSGYDSTTSSVASPRTPTRLETIEPPMMYSPSTTPKSTSRATATNHATDSEIRAFASTLRSPKYKSSDTSSSSPHRTSVKSRGDDISAAAMPPASPPSPKSKTFRSSTASRTTNDTSRHAVAPAPAPAQPENHETFTYTPPQHTFSSSYYQRSSTYGSQTTARAGNLASSTYGSHTTLRTGNLGPRHNRSMNANHVTYHEDDEYQDEMNYAPDSFDEEIMGIITEDPSEDNAIGLNYPPDILNGHDAHPAPEIDGTLNDAYLSDDSDSVPLPMPEHHYRSTAAGGPTDEHAKRRLQMS